MVAGGLAACFLLSTLSAQSLREPWFMAKAQPGFDDIYNLDYDRAEQVFVALKKENPQHPAPPLYLSIIGWLRELLRRQELNLDLFMSPSFFTRSTTLEMPQGQREEFFAHIQECQDLNHRILAKTPKNLDALYFLGSSYGILSAFSITIDRSPRKAFGYGNKAYEYNRQVVKINPAYYDAYMAVGLYQYIAGSIPWYLRWLAAIAGYFGTKEEGFHDLDLAVTKGEYVKTDAQIIRMALRVYEERPRDALAEAQELHRRFPRNFIFQINIAQILERLGREDQAVSEYLAVMRQAEEGKSNYGLLPLTTFRYTLGNRFFRMGRLDAAEGQFRRAIAYPGTPERERTLSQLRLGQILDLQGRRAEAIARYETVLKSKDFDNAQEQARKFLRTPYRG
jgi:tetratricopeptide (TPR) repeat protein